MISYRYFYDSEERAIRAQALELGAGGVGLGGHGWGSTGWAIVIAWTIACTVLARRAYARDTQRV